MKSALVVLRSLNTNSKGIMALVRFPPAPRPLFVVRVPRFIHAHAPTCTNAPTSPHSNRADSTDDVCELGYFFVLKKYPDHQAPAGQQQYAGADFRGVVRAVPGKLPGVVRGCAQESPGRTQGSQSGSRAIGRSECGWVSCPVCTPAAGNTEVHSNAPQGCRSALLAFLRESLVPSHSGVALCLDTVGTVSNRHCVQRTAWGVCGDVSHGSGACIRKTM